MLVIQLLSIIALSSLSFAAPALSTSNSSVVVPTLGTAKGNVSYVPEEDDCEDYEDDQDQSDSIQYSSQMSTPASTSINIAPSLSASNTRVHALAAAVSPAASNSARPSASYTMADEDDEDYDSLPYCDELEQAVKVQSLQPTTTSDSVTSVPPAVVLNSATSTPRPESIVSSQPPLVSTEPLKLNTSSVSHSSSSSSVAASSISSPALVQTSSSVASTTTSTSTQNDNNSPNTQAYIYESSAKNKYIASTCTVLMMIGAVLL